MKGGLSWIDRLIPSLLICNWTKGAFRALENGDILFDILVHVCIRCGI